MVFGGGEAKQMRKQFDEQMENQRQDSDSMVARQMIPASEIGLDSQVSALLLGNERRMLKYKVVEVEQNGEKSYQLKCMEKFPYKEPYADEPLSFMEESEERKILNQFGDTLAQIKAFGDKYDSDMSSTFNMIVNIRENFLLNSRTTGKSGKLSKSQFVESNATIARQMMMPKKKGLLDKFGGLI